MRTETFQISLTVDATDRVTRDEILHDLRPQLEELQEHEPWRSPDGDSWYVNRRSYVEIHDPRPGEKTVTFDPADPVSIIHALRDAVKPETLRIVARAELTR
jgi:hypothetical protein